MLIYSTLKIAEINTWTMKSQVRSSSIVKQCQISFSVFWGYVIKQNVTCKCDVKETECPQVQRALGFSKCTATFFNIKKSGSALRWAKPCSWGIILHKTTWQFNKKTPNLVLHMAIDFQSSMIIMLQKKITHTVIIKGLFTVALVVLHVTQEWGYGRQGPPVHSAKLG